MLQLFQQFFGKKPHTIQLHISSANGFHLRPVAEFVNTAKTFACDISALHQHKSVSAKSVNALLSLGLEKGDSFTLLARGKDAKVATETLQALFARLMQEDKEVSTLGKETKVYEGQIIEGEIISRGVVIAPVCRYAEREFATEARLDFSEALAKSLDELEILYLAHKEEENGSIYLAQKALLHAIADDLDSFETFELTIAEASAHLTGSKMASKIIDYQDILRRVKNHMGIKTEMILPETSTILLAEDLLPSQITQLRSSHVEGVVLKETTLTSHTAILLRAAGIPSLIADYSTVEEHSRVILDANSGMIVSKPSEKDLTEAEKRKTEDRKQRDIAANKRFEKALTRTQKQIHILSNVTDIDSAKEARAEGAEGIGLLRTEFLFKNRKPSLEEQTKAYTEIFSCFENITVRTLDVGGDKKLPYLTLQEENNPFLGIRGIRLFKTHPQLMEEHLHAIFLAANGRPIKVMFPMVSTVEEFMHAKAFAFRTAEKYDLDISAMLFGIMVEVPSVLFLIKNFNRVTDFYSIGTNDLTQYLFAIERTHPSLKVDEHSSVVFDAIKTVIDQADKPVSICGELAADPKAVGILLKIGIETLSVSPKRIAATKEEIRHV